MLPTRIFIDRSSIAVLVLCTFASWPAAAATDVSTAHKLRIGESQVFQFRGNPSTGYRWMLDRPSSSGLALVKLESLGYASAPHKPGLVGAPAPFRFRVTCLKAGAAHLNFDYVGPTGRNSDKQQDVSVRCQ